MRKTIDGADAELDGQRGALPGSRPSLICVTMWPLETFSMFDNERVCVELLTAAVTVTAPSEIQQYVRAFARASELAVYGADARALITSAIEAL
ncbi:Scr1 family TA system antitoxin-like transcriptional regulator [Streptomyces sp. NPDC088725]|uniref:Scr1 family TA system antitoxin-like transcriptional regulator n=1 Tax=Streptomyces sp. NPDC088725 TaxID=3365873 RepID=UPI00380FC914